jgi:hypothetical protein
MEFGGDASALVKSPPGPSASHMMIGCKSEQCKAEMIRQKEWGKDLERYWRKSGWQTCLINRLGD